MVRAPDPFSWLAAAVFASLIAAMLILGGAFDAEYSGAADEAAHAVTSLLIRDYIGLWPPPSPMPWAVQYYVHYPKVALGHWPPGYFTAQALWWVVFPIGRASAMWFNAATALAAALLFFRLARRLTSRWIALAAGVALLLTPVVQRSVGQTMSELVCLLFGLLALTALAAFLECPDTRRAAAAGFAVAASMAVKGTGLALAPGLLIAALAGQVWRRWSIPFFRIAAVALAAAVPVVVWYLATGTQGRVSLQRWGGMTTAIPWRIDLLAYMTGPGFALLAVVGAVVAFARRQPVALAAASSLAGIVVTSYFVRAMREDRHFVFAVAMILLLAIVACSWLAERSRWLAGLAAAAALALFPYQFYRQHPLGFADVAARVRLPERMLVSAASGWTEGCWIAVVAMREQRPASTILRATKLLAESSWNRGMRYQLNANTAEGVERILDENAVNLVVLHAGADPLPHHPLLEQTVRASASWRACAQSGEVSAYCRALPPKFPPKPARIDLRSHIGEVVEEAQTP